VTDTSNNIVQVEEIFNLKFSQNGNDEYNFVQNLLWNSEITTPACVDGENSGQRVYYCKKLALARFFDVSESTDLTISGSVFVICDGRRMRCNLHMALLTLEKKNNEEDLLAVSSVMIIYPFGIANLSILGAFPGPQM